MGTSPPTSQDYFVENNFLETFRSDSSWQKKISLYRDILKTPILELNDPNHISASEKYLISHRLKNTNMVVYRFNNINTDKRAAIKSFALNLGLGKAKNHMHSDDDGLAELKTKNDLALRGFIPYSDKKLNWHTDGYYYPENNMVKTMLLHCVQPALSGGEIQAIDHEILFGILYRLKPLLALALTQKDTMTIPEHKIDGIIVRECQTGPVFYHDGIQLRMRYTQRKRNIIWKNDPLVNEALNELDNIIIKNTDLIFSRRLKSGEGILCNNIPHRREAYEDASDIKTKRLVYRGRYNEIPNLIY